MSIVCVSPVYHVPCLQSIQLLRRFRKGIVVLCLVAIGSATPHSSASDCVYRNELVAAVELASPEKLISQQYFVKFAARNEDDTSSLGHAWGALGIEYANGFTVLLKLGGLYPNPSGDESVYKFLISGPGMLDFPPKDYLPSSEVRVNIDPALSSKVAAHFDEWSSASYSVPFQNCVHFISALAEVVGIDAPVALGKIPMEYVAELSSAYESSGANPVVPTECVESSHESKDNAGTANTRGSTARSKVRDDPRARGSGRSNNSAHGGGLGIDPRINVTGRRGEGNTGTTRGGGGGDVSSPGGRTTVVFPEHKIQGSSGGSKDCKQNDLRCMSQQGL